MSFPDLLIFSHYYRDILKNLAISFATTFISASVKIGVDMNRQGADFKFNFMEEGSPTLLPEAFSATWAIQDLFNMLNKTQCKLRPCCNTQDAIFFLSRD